MQRPVRAPQQPLPFAHDDLQNNGAGSDATGKPLAHTAQPSQTTEEQGSRSSDFTPQQVLPDAVESYAISDAELTALLHKFRLAPKTLSMKVSYPKFCEIFSSSLFTTLRPYFPAGAGRPQRWADRCIM